ncbi:hypothetical protein OG429_37775 [Streptomyces sp. NBC_00190]|uniref:hypothetical protein n=1 Tax=unclassified Streptomyces TaxID=2593676 RepID=UPI002E2AD897|nr:hypothetical protein [Streptomyces sp. NBC_00190]WSZ44515.1 hypothetical protein OG239_40250 [Streptomyces sp. NBC_00868]
MAVATGHDPIAACSLILRGLRPKVKDRPRAAARNSWREGWQAFSARPWMWGYALAGTFAVPLWLAGDQRLGPLILSGTSGGASHWGWAVSPFWPLHRSSPGCSSRCCSAA